MSSITVTDTATPIASNSQNEIFGQNSGLCTLYLSELPDVTPSNNNLVLGVGTPFTWPTGKQLYAITDKGNTGSIAFTNNGASMGVSTVNAKQSSTPTLLYSTSKLINGNPGFYPIHNPELDVTAYSSIIVSITCDLAPTLTAANYLSAVIEQYDSSELGIFGGGNTDMAQWLIDVTGPQLEVILTQATMTYQVPVKRPKCVTQLAINIGTAIGAATYGIQVFGSHEQITEPKYLSNSGQFASTMGNPGYQMTFSDLVNHLIMVASINGTAQLNGGVIISASDAPLFRLMCMSYGVINTLSSTLIAPNSPAYTSVSRSLLLPALPIQLGYTSLYAAPSNAWVSFIQ